MPQILEIVANPFGKQLKGFSSPLSSSPLVDIFLMIYFQFKQDLVLKMLCLMAVWHPPPPGTQGQWSPGPARTGIPCPQDKRAQPLHFPRLPFRVVC